MKRILLRVTASFFSLALASGVAVAQVTPGTSPLPIAKGGTAGATAAAARTNLGLAIGTNVEAWNALLDCFSALATTGVIHRTGAGTCSAAPVALGSDVSGTLQAANFPALTGDVTTTAGSLTTVLGNAPVIAKVLTGFTSGAGTVTAADSILSAIQKVYGNDALKLPLAGGTMSGNIAMGGNNISGIGAITATTYNGLPVGTNSAEGILQCDGTTTMCSSGKVTAVGSVATAVTPLTTTVTGGTNGDFLGVTASGCVSGSPCLSQVPMTAPLVAYTPQGTGAVATTAAAELNRTIWVNDYGAVCDGATDDHLAFQAAINEGEAIGIPVRFIGNCAISTALSVTSTINFGGVNGAPSSGPSNIVSTSASIDIIDVNTAVGNPVYFHDFSMSYSVAANVGSYR
jgi:hypothetical protein